LAVNNFVATSNKWKWWYTAKNLHFNKTFKKTVPIQQARVRNNNLGVRCKKWFNWTSGVGKNL